MKILVAHNYYQQRGGEDAVCESEIRLLREGGHQVVEYFRHNSEITADSLLAKSHLFWRASWSRRTYRELLQLLRRERPNVAHFHNTFPLLSPSAYYACAAAGVPVVQTLHNYRLLCPAATFLRDGSVCEKCLGRGVALPAVVHACYRNSRPASAAVATMLAVHRARGTWQHRVNVYLPLTEFARQKFIAGGLPPECLLVKHNFLAAEPAPKQTSGDYALYVGRLSEEKGLRVLLDAWRQLPTAIPLKIAGDGPLRGEVLRAVAQSPSASIAWLGHLPQNAIFSLLQNARFLVLPSLCYENFPLTLLEAFACAVPAIAAGHGAMLELVALNETGLHFRPGDPADLGAKSAWAWAHPSELRTMGLAARAEYVSKYTPSAALRQLEAAYEFARQHRHHSLPTSGPPATRPGYQVLGVRVDALQIPGVIAQIEDWIAQPGPCRYIAVTDMHSLMQAQRAADFRQVLQSAALVVPDGYPLVWLGRRKGFALRRRVYGPELLEQFCAATAAKGYRHFFYGGAPGVAERLASTLASRFPGLQVAGSLCPPFRAVTSAEDDEIVRTINAASPDIVWVGLGAPKQERWMFDHCRHLQAPVLVGVGAAFDFHTGRVAQAPAWMRDHGFEWLFRLSREPRRLWRRYLVYGTQFLCLLLLEALGLRKFP